MDFFLFVNLPSIQIVHWMAVVLFVLPSRSQCQNNYNYYTRKTPALDTLFLYRRPVLFVWPGLYDKKKITFIVACMNNA